MWKVYRWMDKWKDIRRRTCSEKFTWSIGSSEFIWSHALHFNCSWISLYFFLQRWIESQKTHKLTLLYWPWNISSTVAVWIVVSTPKYPSDSPLLFLPCRWYPGPQAVWSCDLEHLYTQAGTWQHMQGFSTEIWC